MAQGKGPPEQDRRLNKAIDALIADAEAGGQDAIASAQRAAVLAEGFDPERAGRALALAARLDPLDAWPRLELSRRAAEAGDFNTARREASAVLADSVDQVAQARAAFLLGEIAHATNDRDGARTSFEHVIAIENTLLARDRSDAHAARWHARAAGRLAELDAADGRLAKARSDAATALGLLRALARRDEPPALAADIAEAEARLAAFDLDAGAAQSAGLRLLQATGRYEALSLLEPDEPHWRGVLAECWALASEAAFARGAPEEACAAMDKALALRVKLARNDPAEAWALATTWRLRAGLLASLGDARNAADSLAQARGVAERRCAEAGGEAGARFLTHTLIEQADLALTMRALATARDAALAAVRCAEPFAQTGDTRWRADLAAAWDRVGETARGANALAPAQDAYGRAVELRRMAREAAPGDATLARGLAASLLRSGDVALAAGEAHSARAAFHESVSLRRDLLRGAPRLADAVRDVAVALERLGLAAQACGEAGDARAAWEEELSLTERIFEDRAGPDAQRFRAIVEMHLAGLNGVDAAVLRAAVLTRLDGLEQIGALTPQDAALRAKLKAT